MILLRLSWPSLALWQNRRVHWAARSRATQEARKTAWAEALTRGVKNLPEAETYTLRFSFYPPDKRKRDLHNMPATQKANIDGIADALGVDDSRFRVVWPTEWAEVVKGGAVLVEVVANLEDMA